MAPARAAFTRLLAVVVLLSGGYGASVALHRCPHHQGPMGAAPAGSARSPAAAPAHHGTHGAAPCTCIGACCGSAVTPLASGLWAPTGPEPAPPAGPAAASARAAGPRPAPAPHFHSFANPPPSAG